MRILFVDDEERVLAAIERTVFMAERDWEVDFATSGAEALDKLASQAADVVVSDMRMPLMDGAELLGEVRNRWPCAIRIVLSGHTEQEAALRLLDVAHQFLSKPCDGDALVESIDRAVDLQKLLRNRALQEVVGRIGSLPTAPRMYEHLNRLLCDGTADISQIAVTIQHDPALTAKVLQLGNCAFFHLGHDVIDINTAMVRIGLTTLRTLVLASEVFRSDAHPDADAMRARAVRASRLAGAIGKQYAAPHTVTTAALLAEVGLLLPEIERLCQAADVEGSGFPSHAEVGAYLLGVWGLPSVIVEAVAHHRHPGRIGHRGFDAVGVVHVAVALSKGQAPDEEFLEMTGMTEQVAVWREAYETDRLIENGP